jgi:hypothetical protein
VTVERGRHLFVCALVAAAALAAPGLARASTFTFKPVADAYVTAANPDLNSGLSVDLSASPSPDRRSYLRFTISGLDGAVTKATLRLMPTAAAPVGYEVRNVSVVSWLETGITYNNAPAPASSVAATSGALTNATWSTADVTSLVPGNSTITLAVTSADLTRIWLASRETATSPELVVETNPAPPPNDTTPPPAPTISSQPSDPSAVGDAQFSFVDTEGGVTFACTLDTGTATPCTSPKSYAGLTSGSHTFSVSAADAAGNVSPATTYTWTVNLPPPPPPPAGTSFTATADTFVSAAAPDTNNGTSVDLTASVSPERRSYLRFNVQGLAAGTSVSHATLRLWTTAPSATGYEVHGVSSNTWSESTTTYNNAPPIAPAATSTSGTFANGVYAEADVTQLVAGNGLVSFAITTTDANRAWFSSRETANAPQLVVATAADTTPPPAPTIDSKPTNPSTASDATFAFSDTEAGVTFTCTLDTGAAGPCTSPKSFTSLTSGSHSFSVIATDGAGNASPAATYAWTVNLLPRASFTPVADAFVSAALPDTNNGASVDLTASVSPDRRSYLRFDVSGLKGTVSKATLRLWGTAAAPKGYEVRGVTSNTWAESTITYTNAPPIAATVTGSSGPIALGAFADADVTPLVTGNGLVSLAVTTTDATRNWFASRETANAPQLVVEYVADTTPPPAPTIDSKPANPSTSPSASFTFSDTEAGATFLCSLDGAAFAACTSPQSYSALSEASHTFAVKAADAAGNQSAAATYTWQISIPVVSANGTFTPVADAYVINDTRNKGRNFGSSASLQAQASPVIRSYVKFNVANVGTVTKATLRLRATITSSNGFQVRGVTDTSWGESTITYTNSPAMSSTITADSGAFSNGAWLSLDVTPLVKGNGLVTLGIASLKSAGLTLASRESGANAPQLVVASQAKQDVTPPPAPTIGSGPASPTSSTSATFNFTDTEAGVSFLCQLDAGAFAACTSPKTYTTLTAAGHSFGVKARDAAGNDSPVALWSWTISASDPIIAAVGDIACDPLDVNFNNGLGTATNCVQQKTADMAGSVGASAVLELGDIQYACSGLAAYQQSYDKSWGKLKPISHPTIGNHEYDTSGGTGCDTTGTASGYYDYFGAAAGPRGKGYYSYNVGAWHLIALNSECTFNGGCGAGSPMEQWLRSDLAANPKKCTLAYWHTPRYASGGGETTGLDTIWTDLYNAGAELVLSGHMHWYERFAPMGPGGALDTTKGIRQFIVGTGGKSLHTNPGAAPNSQIRNTATFGVMKLTLHATSYDWQFLPVNGGTFTDSGTQACH